MTARSCSRIGFVFRRTSKNVVLRGDASVSTHAGAHAPLNVVSWSPSCLDVSNITARKWPWRYLIHPSFTNVLLAECKCPCMHQWCLEIIYHDALTLLSVCESRHLHVASTCTAYHHSTCVTWTECGHLHSPWSPTIAHIPPWSQNRRYVTDPSVGASFVLFITFELFLQHVSLLVKTACQYCLRWHVAHCPHADCEYDACLRVFLCLANVRICSTDGELLLLVLVACVQFNLYLVHCH